MELKCKEYGVLIAFGQSLKWKIVRTAMGKTIATREHTGHVWGERERVVPVEQITD